MTLVTFVLRNRGRRLPDWSAAEDEQLTRLAAGHLSETAIAENFKGTRTPSAVKNRLWRLRQEGAVGL